MGTNLIHEVIPVGLLRCNCSILGDRSTHEAIVVDPGDDTERILEVLRRHSLKVRAILSTHTHIDHVGGLAALQQVTGAPVLIHEADLDLYRHLDVQAQWLGVPTPAKTNIQDFVEEGDTVRWGGFAASVLHTPGHTPGSISLVVAAGDTHISNAEKPNQRRPCDGPTAGGRHFIPRQHRAHRPVGRIVSSNSGLYPREVAGASRRRDRIPRPR
jgi:glyoxylase-like metal-dependent hydrolase (beta-lactamase superfamily II)